MTARELNRALLARQHLLERANLPLEAAVEAVGPLQAQYTPAPAVALWSRVRDLTLEGYERAFEERRLVVALLMRGTLHVVSAAEYWAIAAAAHACGRRAQPPAMAESALDVAALEADLAVVCRGGQRTRAAVAAHIREWLAGHGHDPDDPDVARLGRLGWRAVRGTTFLLSVQSRGAWARQAPDVYADAAAMLPRPPAPGPGPALAALVRHHLRAFGPAAHDDIASWIGAVPPAQLRAAREALAPELLRFRDEAGRTLYDLAEAPRPDAGVPAPVRYLAPFDSVLLAYAPRFRGRILPEAHRAAVIRTRNLQVLATCLVDGMVAATWETELRRGEATVLVRPLEPLHDRARGALVEEGERLARFLNPKAASHAARIVA